MRDREIGRRDVADVARLLRRGRLRREPGGADHRHAQRVVRAELDPVERLVDRRACGRRVPVARGELGLERAEHAQVLRLARVDGDLRGPRELRPRLLALVACERELGPPQRDLQLPVATGEPPPRDLGERGVRGLPVARVERLLRDQQRQPALSRRQRGELGVAGAGHLECLRGPARQVQRVAHVHGGRGDVLQVPALARQRERAAQRGGALVERADRHLRDAERVQGADVVDEVAVRVGQRRLLVEGTARLAHGAVVARLQRERLRVAGEQPRALRRRLVVGHQREPPLELLHRLVLPQQRPQRPVQEPVDPGHAARRPARGRRASTRAARA